MSQENIQEDSIIKISHEISDEIISSQNGNIIIKIKEKINEIIISNNKIEEMIKKMETNFENVINNSSSNSKNFNPNFNEINEFIKKNTNELQQLLNNIENNNAELTKKNRIKVALDIKLKETDKSIILYNTENNKGINVYLSNEKINMIKD